MLFERHGGGWQVFDESEKVIDQQNDRHPHHAHLKNFFKCIETSSRFLAEVGASQTLTRRADTRSPRFIASVNN